jgi:hypothetical protein
LQLFVTDCPHALTQDCVETQAVHPPHCPEAQVWDPAQLPVGSAQDRLSGPGWPGTALSTLPSESSSQLLQVSAWFAEQVAMVT